MKKRVISAIVALIIFIPLIILGGVCFKLGVSIISFLAMREFLKLDGNKKRPLYVDILFYAITLLLTLSIENNEKCYLIAFLLPFILVIYCNDNSKYNADDAFRLVGMSVLIGYVFHNMILIRQDNVKIFIYLFIITIFTDTYAQLGGMLIGKHHLAPKISPKKTWEGSVVGSFFGTLCASVFYIVFVNNNVNILGLVIVTLFLSVLGQLGDLFFSAAKRNHKIKDFSNIMPGHGGVLDRLDSIIFVVIGYILLSGIIGG